MILKKHNFKGSFQLDCFKRLSKITIRKKAKGKLRSNSIKIARLKNKVSNSNVKPNTYFN